MNPPPIPGDAQTIGELLRARAATLPTAEALVDPHVRLTFAQLDRLTQRWAAAFAAQGLLPGDRVAVSLPNGVPIAVSFLAAQRGGLVWVGINRAYTEVEQRGLLTDSGARLLLANEVHGPDASMPNRIDPESAAWRALVATAPDVVDVVVDPVAPAAIAYTSGTTGTPKGVVHSQRNILLPGAVAQWRGDGAGRIGMYLPMTSLNMQVLGTVYALVNGECLVCIPRSDVATVVAAVRDEQIVRLSASPTTVHDILGDPSIAASTLASLTDLTLGGAPTNPALEPRFRARFGHGFLSGYGLTEAPASVTRGRTGGPARPGSSGPPLPQYSIDIVDDDGVAQPTGDVGEICVRACDTGALAGVYTPMLGYWQRREATAAALRGGRLHTGDFGWLDDDGELYVVDRRVDLIVRGGSNVYPAEVERVLEADERISECVVVGRSDERLGQVPVAFVRTVPGATVTAAELLALAAESLARFKVPVAVEFVTDLPRNQMGKVLRTELRARLAARPSPAEPGGDSGDSGGGDGYGWPMSRIEYDEFGLFHENAHEYGLPYAGPPVVRRETVVVAPGRSLSALVWGDAQPELCFVHGGAQNAHTWDTVALALDRPLIAVDLPGHGHSDSPGDRAEGQLAITGNGDDVAEVLRALAPGGVHLVGMSLGGLTSIAIAAQHAPLVRSLTLVDITPGVTGQKSQAIAAFVNGPTSFPSFDDILARTVEHNPTRTVASLRRGILHNALQLDDGSWVWRYRRFDNPSPLAERPAGPPAFGSLWDLLETIEAPIMLVRGMLPQSVVDDADEAELLRRRPATRVERIPNAGHSVQGDTPLELAALIADFVALNS